MEQFKDITAKIIGNFLQRTVVPQTKSEDVPPPASSPPNADWAEYTDKLKRIGYAPLPNCPHCHGIGFVHPKLSDGTVNFGKYINCEAKGCVVDKKREWQQGADSWKRYGITKTDQTFASFQQVMGTVEAYQAFHALAMGEGKVKPFLLCCGGTGNGKTHLCNALVVAMITRGLYPKMYNAAEVFSELKASFKTNQTENLIHRIKTVQVLIIDDFGMNYGSDWEMARMDEIIDYRYNHELITVITTNLDVKQIPDRIFSRFSDTYLSVIVCNLGGDYRPNREGGL